jgi:ABC-type Mn2+/Zn2+ transport system ATPase subunit
MTNKEDVKNLFKEFLQTKPSLEDFQAKAKVHGFSSVRVSSVNGEQKMLTMDYNPQRINVEMEAPVKTWNVVRVGNKEIREAVVDMDKATVTTVDFIG